MRITRVANITGLDVLNIPVWIACRPNSRSLAVSQGKGLDHPSAKASALMESVEAHHAERITLPLKYASYNDLRFTHQIAEISRLARTIAPFDLDSPILWIESKSILSDLSVWVPFELVHLNFTLPPLPGSGLFLATSNGLASGNHKLEAISHGLCELVERDALTLWTQSGGASVPGTRVNLDTIDDPSAREVLDLYRRAEVGVAVWNITSDVAIPAFVCMIADQAVNPIRWLPIARGSGCHPAREIALLRALTEAAQSRLTVISGSRDDLTDAHNALRPSKDGTERSRGVICEQHGTTDFRAIPTWRAESIDEDVATEVERLAAAGMDQVLVVDLTRREFRIPVVRVIVPGLEGLHEAPGYAAGARARRYAEAGA